MNNCVLFPPRQHTGHLETYAAVQTCFLRCLLSILPPFILRWFTGSLHFILRFEAQNQLQEKEISGHSNFKFCFSSSFEGICALIRDISPWQGFYYSKCCTEQGQVRTIFEGDKGFAMVVTLKPMDVN